MPVVAVKTSRRTIGFKPNKYGYLRLSVHRPHERRAPVFCDLAKGVPSADGAGRCRFQHALTTCSYQLADRTHLCGLGGEDVGVTGVDDGHGGATEELTAGGTELDLYYGKRFKSVKVDPPKTLCMVAERASSQGSRVSMSSRAMIKAPSRDMRFFLFFLNRVWNVRCCR